MIRSMRMTKGDWRNLLKGLAFISPWLIGFSLFMALPIVLSLYFSLTDYKLLEGGAPVFVGLDNFAELLWKSNEHGTIGDPVFWKALVNTGYYAILALPAGMLVSLGMALLLNARVAGQSFYRTIIFLPSIVPLVASAMLWMWLFNQDHGLINAGLEALGLPGPGWLTDARTAMPALALMSLWGVGQTVVIYLAGLQDVPVTLYEAADIDGAGAWTRMVHVTLPTISPVIFFNLIMAIIGTIQVFAQPYIMTAGGPGNETYFYTMYLYDNAFKYINFGYASALAWIQFLIILFFTGIAFWTSKRWVHYQGD